MVLAEFAGSVAQIQQEFGERRGSRLQVRRTAGELWWDHARAERVHTGKERIAPGGATLHGQIVHKHRTFVSDTIDIWRLANHQPAVVDARLHPADIIA